MSAHEINELFNEWDSFYVMLGGAAAALTGLMFVVITIVTDNQTGGTEDGLSTFSTPTVVHFCNALFVSAVMAAPFHAFLPITIILGLAGVVGLVNVTNIARKTSKLTTYRPDFEDWLWNVVLPFVAYATLVEGALGLRSSPALALYAPAAAVTLLIFIGIHNAWDVVTYLATGKAKDQDRPEIVKPKD